MKALLIFISATLIVVRVGVRVGVGVGAGAGNFDEGSDGDG